MPGFGGSVFLTFWPVMHYDFVNFDDIGYIIQNRHVQTGFQLDNLKWAFTSFMQETGILSRGYRILSTGDSLALKSGGLIHLCSSACCNTRSFVSLLRSITRICLASAFVADSLSSSNARGVSRVDRRGKDVLSTFFFILTIWAYCRYGRIEPQNSKLKTQNYSSPSCLFALGLMSKPMLVTLPFVLLLLDFWPLKECRVSSVEGARIQSRKSKVKVQSPK